MSLSAIVNSLAVQAVLVNGSAPTVYHGATLPNAAHTAQTPCRLIFTADPNGKGGNGDFVAIGKLTAVEFQLTDLMLWRPSAQGIGRANVDPFFIEYIDNYNAMLKGWRNAGQSAAVVKSWSITPGVYEYPESSGVMYWGVGVVLSIVEYNG